LDGPRMCPGRHFALTILKAVVSVLLSNFSFEFPDGADTKIEIFGVRAKVVGQQGLRMPFIVKQMELWVDNSSSLARTENAKSSSYTCPYYNVKLHSFFFIDIAFSVVNVVAKLYECNDHAWALSISEINYKQIDKLFKFRPLFAFVTT